LLKSEDAEAFARHFGGERLCDALLGDGPTPNSSAILHIPAKYRDWNKADAPAASHFFTPITEKEAA
jgi:hypothetical protein